MPRYAAFVLSCAHRPKRFRIFLFIRSIARTFYVRAYRKKGHSFIHLYTRIFICSCVQHKYNLYVIKQNKNIYAKFSLYTGEFCYISFLVVALK